MSQSKKISWESFKDLITPQDTYYEESNSRYDIFGESALGALVFECTLHKGDADATEFESSFKSSATKTNQ